VIAVLGFLVAMLEAAPRTIEWYLCSFSRSSASVSCGCCCLHRSSLRGVRRWRVQRFIGFVSRVEAVEYTVGIVGILMP
jgi:hypothetical protein